MSRIYGMLSKRVRIGMQYTALLAAAAGLAEAWPAPSAGCDSVTARIPLWQVHTSAGDLCFVGDPPTGATTTLINTPLVAVKVELIDKKGKTVAVLDPIAPLSPPVNSIPGFNALDAVLASPIFENHKWTVGAADLGTVQWGEAVERASFWQYPGTDFTSWQLQMSPPLLSEQTLKVSPPNWAASSSVPGAYQVDDSVLRPYLDNLALSSVTLYPKGAPILLTYNVEKSKGTSCCARGYHAHVTDSQGYRIPYMWASYMDATASAPNPDLNPLSHEVAEFVLNPMNDNSVTPGWPSANSFKLPWKLPYKFTKCDSSFEDGDPIEDRPENLRLFTITTSVMSYHFQNVATASWLMRASPAFSAHKQYAFPNVPDGEFDGPAPVCPATLK